MRVELLRGTADPEELACRAARGDYSNEWMGTENTYSEIMESVEGNTLEEKTDTLLRHCYSRGHHGVFEHPTATFAVEGLSRSCMAQLTRHRHASFDVQSLRYTEIDGDSEDVMCFPPSFTEGEVVSREEGVTEFETPAGIRTEIAANLYDEAVDAYDRLIDAGVPKEDARMVLPIGTLVNLTFTMNARSLMHLLDMRLKPNSQWEIRGLCDDVLAECKDWMPITFELYDDQRPNKLAP